MCRLLIGFLTLALGAAAAATAPGPNIVFILADDLGYGDLGCYGQRRIKTPHLDRLAAEGVRFTRFYAGSTVCAPSRNVLMTGQHTGHALIRGNAKLDLRPEDVTVAEVLKRDGYATGMIGKWGLGKEGSTGSPNRQGFDHFFGYTDQSHAHNYYPHYLVRNDVHVPLRNVVPDPGPYGQGVATKKVEYSPDLLIEDALQFLEENRGHPFFLCFTTTLPHANNEAKEQGMEVPDLGAYEKESWPLNEKAYAAMVTRLDRDVGRLLAKLDELGLARDTVVFFTSDNGPHREGGHDPDFFDSNGPLRGIKRDLYEGGIRVPMITRWPGRAPAGANSNHIGYFGDFMATAVEIAGMRAPNQPDSTSFLPSILGRTDEQKDHEYLYWEFYEGKSAQAVLLGNWKAVRAPMLTGKIELYDLNTDLAEQHNIAADHPDIVERALAIMEQAHEPSPLWRLGAAVYSGR